MSNDPKQTLIDRIAGLDARREELFALKKPIDEELVSTYERREKAQDALSKILAKEMKATGTVDWAAFIKKGHHSGQEFYRLMGAEAHKHSVYSSGVWPETNESAFQLMLYKKHPERTALAKQFIELTAPLYTPIEGVVHYGIFDKSLNASGPYYLFVQPDLSGAEVVHYWTSRPDTKFKGTLDGALAYIQENLYYAKNYKGQ